MTNENQIYRRHSSHRGLVHSPNKARQNATPNKTKRRNAKKTKTATLCHLFFRRPSRKALLETSGRPEDLTTSNNVETGVLPRQPGCRGKTAHVKRARRSTNVGIRCERVRGRRPKAGRTTERVSREQVRAKTQQRRADERCV